MIGAELFTAAEVAGMLKVDSRAVLRYAREGKLSCARLDSKNIRFTGEQVEDFILSRSSSSRAKSVDNCRTGRLPYLLKGGGKSLRGLQSPDFSPTDRQEMKKWR